MEGEHFFPVGAGEAEECPIVVVGAGGLDVYLEGSDHAVGAGDLEGPEIVVLRAGDGAGGDLALGAGVPEGDGFFPGVPSEEALILRLAIEGGGEAEGFAGDGGGDGLFDDDGDLAGRRRGLGYPCALHPGDGRELAGNGGVGGGSGGLAMGGSERGGENGGQGSDGKPTAHDA